MRGSWKVLLHVLITTLFCSSVASHPPTAARDQIPITSIAETPWDAPADFTSSLVFNAVNSLLQHWPNTRYRNGHSIVAATIGTGTVLYHGRSDDAVPTKAEWFATDFEHSYLFCDGDCYVLTYVATREIRLVYFDGSSADKLASGPLDSQDFLTRNITKDGTDILDDYVRIKDLCEWARHHDVDGFVRMEFDFEIMACDFSNGFQLLTHSKLVPSAALRYKTPYWPNREPKLPEGWKGRIRSVPSLSFEVIYAAAMHNRAPGETRVKIDYSRLFTFYDPSYTSLAAARAHQKREEYRPANLSVEDGVVAERRLKEMFRRSGHGSGMDWGSIVHVLVDRYGERLKLLEHILNHPGFRNVTEQATEVRSQVLIMLTPYMLADVIPSATSGSRDWIAPISKHCASTLTSWTPDVSLLTPEEMVVKVAVEDVSHEICRVVSDIWVDAFGIEEAAIRETSALLQKWKNDIHQLMVWLDWSMWDTCSPACGAEELCYRPMWPWINGGIGEYPDDGGLPRCISRVAPYASFLDL